jgi:hypothetical protein
MTETDGKVTARGSCLCGGVVFEVVLPTLVCAHCHCTMCRRAHGAAFVTWFTVLRSHWRISEGEDLLQRYHSSDHATRSFCGRCGSSLFFETSREPDRMDIVLANMDDTIDRVPQLHIYSDDRVPWVGLEDGLPQLGGESGMEPR